ncbi:MAG: PilZ domain-containing protein [Deltaproteobacteria bacterium]|nr:PilZ domain-containing protein [Deltaproteobacteria bacterium]
MSKTEKRKHDRIDSLNLSYLCVNENNEIVKQGMGRTLNVSESGILLETVFAIEKHQLLSVSIGIENDLVDIQGRVIHCRTGRRKRFETGIEFIDISESSLVILQRFVNFFLNNKE